MVVVADVVDEDALEMALADDQEAVGALGS
jgi:hypothetical protein